jgi:hypothetical protein
MFGLPVPQDVIDAKGNPVRYWGCRAIDERGTLDIVHDRVTYNGPEWDKSLTPQAWRELPFVWWLNKVALPELRLCLPNMAREQVLPVCDEGLFCLIARRAGGYVYVGAWEHHTATSKYDLPQRPDGEWSGTFDPNVGDRVEITFNGLGLGPWSATSVNTVTVASESSWTSNRSGIRSRATRPTPWSLAQRFGP